MDLGSALLIQEMGASSEQKIEMVNKNLQTFIPKVGSSLPYLILKGGDLKGNANRMSEFFWGYISPFQHCLDLDFIPGFVHFFLK